jgi:hypothetical protein
VSNDSSSTNETLFSVSSSLSDEKSGPIKLVKKTRFISPKKISDKKKTLGKYFNDFTSTPLNAR